MSTETDAVTPEPHTGSLDGVKTVPNAGKPPLPPVEIGGPKGLEPTRYGDWERKGRCFDF